MHERILEEFRDLRWVPLQPKFIDYPNAQILMIGEAQGSLGKAGSKEGHEGDQEAAGEELERLEEEDAARASPLRGKLILLVF